MQAVTCEIYERKQRVERGKQRLDNIETRNARRGKCTERIVRNSSDWPTYEGVKAGNADELCMD